MAGSTPHEYASRVILPALRGLVAHVLAGDGLKQYSIARILGVSQPMVHKYLSRGPEAYLAALEKEGVERGLAVEAAEAAARALASGRERDFWLIVNELTLRSRGCAGGSCEGVLCPSREVFPLTRYEAVLERLASIPCLERILPEVGGNLAYAPRAPPGGPRDIVALDGRIVKAASGVLVAGKPRFGGSRHTASILVRYSKLNPRIRWALALSPRPGLIEALRSRGVEASATSGGAPQGSMGAVLEEAAPGREAVLYILAEDWRDLLDIVAEAAKRECQG